ncbi:insulinase family protein [bacterium]|nr:insulinase family protein [candidate division CSSED10-310 bacterium]
MKTSIPILLIAVSGLCMAQTLPAPDQIACEPIEFNPLHPAHITFSNGLDMWMLEDKSLPLLSVVVNVGVGHEMDPEERFGLAEMTAQMIVQGGSKSKSPNTVDDLVDTHAIRLSAGCDARGTQIRLWCMSQDTETALPLLAELLRTPGFDSSRKEFVRESIAAQIRQLRDYPFFEAFQTLTSLLYGNNHPVARLPSETELGQVTRDDMVTFHHIYYQPDITRIGIVGDFDRADMRRRIETLFGSWKGSAGELMQPRPAGPDYRPNHVYIVDKPGTQAALAIGHLGLPPKNPHHYNLELFSRIFGSSGFSSRLMQKVRTEHGYAYTVFGGFKDELPVGKFEIGCQTQIATAADAVRVVLDILSDMRTRPATEPELDQAKTAIENSFIFNFERPAFIIERLFHHLDMGFKADYLDTYLERIRNVTPESILRTASAAIDPDKLVVVAVGPQEALTAEFAELGWPVVTVKDVISTPVQ